MVTRANILVVESEDTTAVNIEMALKAANYNVVGTLTTGEEAIEAIKVIKPDIILLDIILAGKLNGIGVYRKIKKIIDVPVIYLTDFSDEVIIKKAKLSNPASLILKPFNNKELCFNIEVVLHTYKKQRRLLEENNKLKEDINKHRLLQKEYSNTRYLLSSVIELAPVAMVLISVPDMVIRAINKAFIDMFGIKRSDYKIGDSVYSKRVLWEDFYEDGTSVAPDIEGVLIYKGREGITTKEDNILTKRGDGSTFWRAAYGFPIYDNLNNLIAIQLISVDITDHKINEMNIKQLNEVLENKVRLRTEQLEAANKELEAFSYSVAHDLRAPLRSISGFATALGEDYHDVVDELGKDYIKRLQNGVINMERLINNLLQLFRVKKEELKFSSVELSELGKNIIYGLKASDPSRKVKYICNQEIQVIGDKFLLDSMLANLIGNAWKFTKKKDEAIIEMGKAIKDDEVVYYIRDNGVGFDMKYCDNLFNVFHRLHSAKDFEGTGIGLATVKKIINKHNGRIWAESKPNEGATFYFTLSSK